MVVETVYPIVRALSRGEQIKLYEQLEKDLQSHEETSYPKKMSAKEMHKAERMRWLKEKIRSLWCRTS